MKVFYIYLVISAILWIYKQFKRSQKQAANAQQAANNRTSKSSSRDASRRSQLQATADSIAALRDRTSLNTLRTPTPTERVVYRDLEEEQAWGSNEEWQSDDSENYYAFHENQGMKDRTIDIDASEYEKVYEDSLKQAVNKLDFSKNKLRTFFVMQEVLGKPKAYVRHRPGDS